MAIVLRSLRTSIPVQRPIALPRASLKVVPIVKGLILAWIGLNMLTWAPAVDAKGNCNCPICSPFGAGASIR